MIGFGSASLPRIKSVRDGGIPVLEFSPSSHSCEGRIDWSTLWSRCERKIRRWRTPPRWSFTDWMEEARSHAAMTAWQAARDFDPGRGITPDLYLQHRVLGAVLRRYRQEWNHGLRAYGDPDRALDCEPMQPAVHDREEIWDRLQGSLARLDAEDRRILDSLYWGGQSESEIASRLGISQQAISKRKLRLIRRLRRDLTV